MGIKNKIDTEKEKNNINKMLHKDTSTKNISADQTAQFVKEKSTNPK